MYRTSIFLTYMCSLLSAILRIQVKRIYSLATDPIVGMIGKDCTDVGDGGTENRGGGRGMGWLSGGPMTHEALEEERDIQQMAETELQRFLIDEESIFR